MRTLILIFVSIPAALAQSAAAPAPAATVVPPSLVHKSEPEYTAEARVKGIEGVVNLYAEVTKDGTPVNIKVVKALDPGLDAKAIEAVKTWRFLPGKRAGQPVTVSAVVEVKFQLPRYPVLPSAAPRPELPLPQEKPVCKPFVIDEGIVLQGICVE